MPCAVRTRRLVRCAEWWHQPRPDQAVAPHLVLCLQCLKGLLGVQPQFRKSRQPTSRRRPDPAAARRLRCICIRVGTTRAAGLMQLAAAVCVR